MKNIVFCADGTWNGKNVDDDDDGVPDATNVLKVFHLLQGDTTLDSRRLKNENEKLLGGPAAPQLVAKYLHGVGDTSNPIERIVGGAFGSGLVARIIRGYTFISRHYRPGDRIVIVGFSRGAYTARALAGMISSVGLLDPADMAQRPPDTSSKDAKARAYSMGVSAWLRYREIAMANQTNVTLRQRLAHLLSSFPLSAKATELPPNMVKAPIHVVAVWDTVGALGIPNMGAPANEADAFRFADDLLSSNVAHGLHAVSFDEKRPSFVPTLWRPDPRIKQYGFGGAHADVGGGYPERESGLSNIALKWMIDELTLLGLSFKPMPQDWPLDPLQPQHEPWKEGVFRYVPPADRDWRGYQLTEHPSLTVRRGRLASEQPCP